MTVRPHESLELFAAMDYTSGAFDDALSVRPLDSYWNTQLGLEMEVNEDLSIRAMVDNVFDEEIQTGLASNGLMSIGAPRTFWLSARIEW
jgi:outer membrane receptor for ferrienterochelin and colicin